MAESKGCGCASVMLINIIVIGGIIGIGGYIAYTYIKKELDKQNLP